MTSRLTSDVDSSILYFLYAFLDKCAQCSLVPLLHAMFICDVQTYDFVACPLDPGIGAPYHVTRLNAFTNASLSPSLLISVPH